MGPALGGKMKKCISCGITVFLLVFLFGNILRAQNGSVTVQWGDDSKQGPDGGAYKKKGGPPSHAPAHGYRAKHQYSYYPYHNVYHEPSSGMYFYMSGGGWRVGASLPASLTGINLGASVNIDMDSDRPYDHNHDHAKEYPKDKYKPEKDEKEHGGGSSKGKGKGGKQ